MNIEFKYNETIFPNEEFALISIIEDEWQIEEYSVNLIFREACPTDEIDFVFCGILNHFGGTLTKVEFARLLGLSLLDIPEQNIYRDKAEEMVLDELLTPFQTFRLIEQDKKSVIQELTLTKEGEQSLHEKIKYSYWEGKMQCFKHSLKYYNTNFNFHTQFDLATIISEKQVTSKHEFQSDRDTFFFQMVDYQLSLSSDKFELLKIVNSYKTRNNNKTVRYALFQKDDVTDFLLVLLENEVQKELTSIINDPRNKEYKNDLVLRCKFKALLEDKTAIFDGKTVNEFIKLWNRTELIEDPRLMWADDELWTIFSTQFNVKEWYLITQKAQIDILKKRVSEFYNRFNWTILSERLDEGFIFKHLYTEGYRWDFKFLSTKNIEFVWSLIERINDYNLNNERKISPNWDFLRVTGQLSDERVQYLIHHRYYLDFIQLSKREPEFVLSCLAQIDEINDLIENEEMLYNMMWEVSWSDIDYLEYDTTVNNNKIKREIPYKTMWDWTYISENWGITTIWNNIDLLEDDLNWHIFLKRAFSDSEFADFLLKSEQFKDRLLQNKEKVRPTFRLENLLWSEPLIDLFNDAGIILWQSGFECNPHIVWTPTLLKKYATLFTTSVGKNHISKSIKSWDVVLSVLDFEWNWNELCQNKYLTFDIDILNSFRSSLNWTILSERLEDDFILSHLTKFDWNFRILSKKSNAFIMQALKVDESIQKNWDWTILSERLEDDFILSHLTKFDWNFRILSKKSNAFIMQALKVDESIQKNWDWQHLTKILDKNFIRENLARVNEKWDWNYLTKEKFTTDEIIDLWQTTVQHWDWNYLLTKSFSVKELTDNDFFILVGSYLNLIENDENRKKYWSVLTKKMTPDFFAKNKYDYLQYPMLQWDWSYLSQYPRFEFTIDFIQKFERKWDWNILSQNTKINADWDYLYYYRNNWDWAYISQYSRFLVNKNHELKLNAIKKFQKLINFKTLSLRTDIIIDNQLINEFTQKNWDFSFLSGVKSVKPNYEFLRKYANRNWDWQKLSKREDLKVEVKQNFKEKKFINKLILEFKDKDWDWQYLSKRNDIEFNLEFLEELLDKNWDFKTISRNNQTVWNDELIKFFQRNSIELDWNFISKNNEAIYKNADRLEALKEYLNWDNLSRNQNIELNEDLLRRFAQNWNFSLLTQRKEITCNSQYFIKYKDKDWDWQYFTKKLALPIDISILADLSDKIEWNILSESRNIKVDENLLDEFSDYWNFRLLTKREEIITNPQYFIKHKDKDWDWQYFTEKLALPIDISILADLSDKIEWNILSESKNIKVDESLLDEFSDYWNFRLLTKREEIITNPQYFIKHKDKDWDWQYFTERLASSTVNTDRVSVHTPVLEEALKKLHKLTLTDILSDLSDKIEWNELSKSKYLRLTTKLIKKFSKYWDFVELFKQRKRFKDDIKKALEPYFDEPKTKFLIKIDEQCSSWKGYIYHFTHLSNAGKIIKEMSIKSRYSAKQINNSAGNVPNSSDKPKTYARFYFRPHTPTQFYNENLGKSPKDNYELKHWEYFNGDTKKWIHESERKHVGYYSEAANMGFPKCPVPIFFKIDIKEILDKFYEKCFISNGNMQSNWANIFTIKEGIKRFDFSNLFMDFLPQNKELYKEASQQEFLIKNELCLSDLQTLEIICQSHSDKQALVNLIGLENPFVKKITVDEYKIYHNKNSRFDIEANELSLSISTSFDGEGSIIVKTAIENCISQVEGDVYVQKPKITEGGKNLKITFSNPTKYQVLFKDESRKEWLLYLN